MGPITTDFGVELYNVTKAFGGTVNAVNSVSLSVAKGTFVSLLGPSGCGKTTTLRMIAGLEKPTSGQIKIFGKTVYSNSERIDLDPKKRSVGFVFQSYALWPHMTVYQNVAYPLVKAGIDKHSILDRVMRILAMVKCDHLSPRYPGELSGGQQQRIALARALVNFPPVILFDEPLSNLDAKLRDNLRFELRNLQTELGFTAIYVTHDQAEALSMSDNIVVMKDGRIEQQGDPKTVFHRPRSAYVADFFGITNIVTGHILNVQGERLVCESVLGPLTAVATMGGPSLMVGKAVQLAVHSDRIKVTRPSDPDGAQGTRAVVQGAAYYGMYTDLLLETADGCTFRSRVAEGDLRVARGETVIITPSGEACVLSE